ADLRSEAWSTDTSELRRSLAELGGRWWRFLSTRWRQAKKSVAALCTSAQQLDWASQLALLDGIAESAQCAGMIAVAGEYMARLLTASWKGADSEWDLIARQADWVIAAHKGIHQEELAAWCVEPALVAVDRAVASARIGELDRSEERRVGKEG